ncbi:MAG: hypothetical protein MUC38_00085 [Cyclobacteriaceae bacterium]|jgi:hypothetical protein|nr:hypothetical protein [Cyclobacteriaceae bacterium]
MKKQAAKKTTRPLRPKKSWTDKVNDPTKSFIVKKLDNGFADMPAGAKMLIATPKIVDDYVRDIPKGKSVTLKTLRSDLAREYRAEYTCPVTTGIFLRLVSEAAHEQLTQGKPLGNVAPFWRVVGPQSALNKKLSFGESFVKKQRKAEGIAD